MDARCVHRVQPGSGEGGARRDGEDGERAPAPAREARRQAPRQGRGVVARRRGPRRRALATVDTRELASRIEQLAATPAGVDLPADAEEIVGSLLAALERGAVRAAEKTEDGDWRAVPWVKRGILLGFRAG